MPSLDPSILEECGTGRQVVTDVLPCATIVAAIDPEAVLVVRVVAPGQIIRLRFAGRGERLGAAGTCGTAVGGTDVAVGGTGVEVGGTGVEVAGLAVAVAVGWAGCDVAVGAGAVPQSVAGVSMVEPNVVTQSYVL